MIAAAPADVPAAVPANVPAAVPADIPAAALAVFLIFLLFLPSLSSWYFFSSFL